MTDDPESYIRELLPRELLLDLFDMAPAKAQEAHNIIKNHTRLEGKSARGAEGQIRYRITEKDFQDICEKYGGFPLEEPFIPGSKLKFFQPFMRFQKNSKGLILALASMPVRGELPPKNKSRTAGVTINFNWTPRFDFDGRGLKKDDIFLCFLACRDKNKAGHIAEIALGVIDAEYKAYIFYRPIEEFLNSYSSTKKAEPKDGPMGRGEGSDGRKKRVTLKKTKKPFEPPRKDPSDKNIKNPEDSKKRNEKKK